jgi:hypothetical protein
MSTSALPSFLSAVITALKADSNLSNVRVFDGIEIDQSYPGDAIAIGHDGSTEGDDMTTASVRQEYIQLGAKNKFEDAEINCALWSWDGTSDLASRRTRAFAILGEIETVIRSDVSFGGVVIYSGLESHQLNYRQTNAGAAVVITFTITYRAKI